MILGYNTNGFAHHPLPQTLEILSQLSYQSVAITLDHGSLSPYSAALADEQKQIRDLLHKFSLQCTIETGSRFLLDPWRKHQPTLLASDAKARAHRHDFLRRAIDIATAVGSTTVSLWSGSFDPEEGASPSAAILLERLATELRDLVTFASDRGVTLGFEPEPGMFIDTMAQWDLLLAQGGLEKLGLTLDVGHLHCLGEFPVANYVRKYAPHIVNIHLEDMRQGIHEHLLFGEGEMDFPPILAALADAHYSGPLHVELSWHSHAAPSVARQSLEFLAPLVIAAQKR